MQLWTDVVEGVVTGPVIASEEELFIAKVAGHRCVPSYFIVYGPGDKAVDLIAHSQNGSIFFAKENLIIENEKHILRQGTYFELVAIARSKFISRIIAFGSITS